MQQNKKYKLPQIKNLHLTKEELNILKNFDFSESIRLDIIKDYFLLCCYTGLTIKEIQSLNYESFYKKIGNDSTNEFHVLLKEKSTTKDVIISNTAFNIFYKYEWELPKIIAEEIRKGLKEIGKIISNENTLSTEIRRKLAALSFEYATSTFCHLFLNDGVPLYNICNITRISVSDFLDTNVFPSSIQKEISI